MKVYISSTYLDLKEHRTAVAETLRKMGHSPVLMEDYVAEDKRPLKKCLEDVDQVDCYIGLFAWRYGFVPPKRGNGAKGLPAGVKAGRTSITEAEYRRAVERKIPNLAFLLDETASWNPQMTDAFTGDNEAGVRITSFRTHLKQSLLIDVFSSPEQLASLVGPAVYQAEMRRKLDVLSLGTPLDMHDLLMTDRSHEPPELHDSTLRSIKTAIQKADQRKLMRVDLSTGRNWWSTRLYFLADMTCEFTDIRCFVFVDAQERLVGVATPQVVRDRIMRRHPVLKRYEADLDNPDELPTITNDADRRSQIWLSKMADSGGEVKVKVWATKAAVKSWLGDDLLLGRVDLPSEKGSSAVVNRKKIAKRLGRIVDWPHPYVPLEQEGKLLQIIDRDAIIRMLAKQSLQDLGN